ncbi:hypothetical protein [Halobaculum sp. P14]
MKRPSGHEIEPHYHKDVVREVERTQEVLVIREGKVRVDIYDDDEREIESLTLEDGDVILLAAGGHGFEMLEETEMVEVKQGPYAGEDDKVHITRSESGDT